MQKERYVLLNYRFVHVMAVSMITPIYWCQETNIIIIHTAVTLMQTLTFNIKHA